MNSTNTPCNKIQAIRNAIREELDALNTYDVLKEVDPANATIYEEIKKDEANHAGRLTDLLLLMDDAAFAGSFSKGLEQEETNA